jgi:hypothetical protein
MASRFTTSVIACISARSERRNFSRAGVAWKRSRNSTTVPRVSAAGFTALIAPPETSIRWAGAPSARLVIVRRPTAPRDGSASPRKPKLVMFRRSVPSILDVA